MFSEILNPYKHVLAAQYRKKKPSFLACNSEYVHAAILESSKINGLL